MPLRSGKDTVGSAASPKEGKKVRLPIPTNSVIARGPSPTPSKVAKDGTDGPSANKSKETAEEALPFTKAGVEDDPEEKPSSGSEDDDGSDEDEDLDESQGQKPEAAAVAAAAKDKGESQGAATGNAAEVPAAAVEATPPQTAVEGTTVPAVKKTGQGTEGAKPKTRSETKVKATEPKQNDLPEVTQTKPTHEEIPPAMGEGQDHGYKPDNERGEVPPDEFNNEERQSEAWHDPQGGDDQGGGPWDPQHYGNRETSYSQLNRAQQARSRRNSHRGSHSRSRSASPKLNTWMDKGKGLDPSNWGGLQGQSDVEPEIQHAVLSSYNTFDDPFNLHKKVDADYEWENNYHRRQQEMELETIRRRQLQDERRRQRLENEQKRREYQIYLQSIEVGGSISTAQGPGGINPQGPQGPQQTQYHEYPTNPEDNQPPKKDRKAALRPTQQLESGSYINNAFERAERLGKRKTRQDGGKPDPESSSSSSDDADDEGGEGGPPGGGRPNPEPSDDGGDQGNDGGRRRRRSKGKSWKPIAPETYDGKADMATYHRFMTQTCMYIEDSGIPSKRQVYKISTFLKGHAYSFYARVVSPSVENWTVSQFFKALFDACFPVDYKERQRDILENIKQGKYELRSYLAKLDELFMAAGVMQQREQARYLWRGLRAETKERLRYDGISPESSSLGRIVRKAEHAELAWKLTQSQRQERDRSNWEDRKPRNRRPNKNREGYVGRKTNGQPSGSNSNQTQYKNHYNKTEKNRKDYKEKPTHHKTQLSAEEKSRRKADGLCYNCGKSDHMARNCPKANSVNEKGSRANRIDNYNVNFSSKRPTRDLRRLAETTESTHDVRVNMMEWASDDFGVGIFDSDSEEFVDVKSSETWDDEVEKIFSEFSSDEEIGDTSSSEFFTAPEPNEWTDPTFGADWTPEYREPANEPEVRLGDPVLERIETCLTRGAPYDQDRRRGGALSKERFYVHRAQGVYEIADATIPHETDICLPWESARDPRFDICGWYQKRLDEMFGAPAGRNRRLERRRPIEMGDLVAEEIEIQLTAGISKYPGESYHWLPHEGRFKVKFNPNDRDYLVEDTALNQIYMNGTSLDWYGDTKIYGTTSWTAGPRKCVQNNSPQNQTADTTWKISGNYFEMSNGKHKIPPTRLGGGMAISWSSRTCRGHPNTRVCTPRSKCRPSNQLMSR
ncbi:hypothetical protein D9611_003825 [Ephemerocybe angulata]|uniref:CCHC-type domain-containing protein n=1 Tax=Ephemerocybe angulata TaxID=980116 RepID=A0A8H5B5U5_9AGAR|nr:hypothetical protein D9611_003825 [Tulosesus angulatus]